MSQSLVTARFEFRVGDTGKRHDAYSQSTDSSRARTSGKEEKDSSDATLSAKARCLHARLYHDTEEAELSTSQSSSCALNKWF